MKSKLFILSVGFALFSMFFGSGNLVFPLSVGQESGGHFGLGALGILLTGVVVPFLGVLAMVLYKGDSRGFFGSMGKNASFIFSLIALSLMGPFGVLARCIAVAHGSFRLMFPDVSLIAFSIASCLVVYLVTMKKNKIVPLLGSLLTPFLLVSLGAITLFGFWFGVMPEQISGKGVDALQNGFFQGYQTMDLLAAFFFSSFVISHVEKETHLNGYTKSPLKIFLQSAILGASLLAAVYIGLVFLGATYAADLAGTPPQEMLGVVAHKALGVWSAPIVCLAVVLACFTTAVVLAALYAEFLKKEVCKDKISEPLAMGVTLLITFCISTLEFAGIARFLAPILETLYPALIVMTLINICSKLWGWSSPRWPVVLAFVAKLCVI